MNHNPGICYLTAQVLQVNIQNCAVVKCRIFSSFCTALLHKMNLLSTGVWLSRNLIPVQYPRHHCARRMVQV